MSSTALTIIAIVAIVIIFIIIISYVKAPPSIAFIVSGLNRKPRIYIGKGGLRIPLLERLDKVYLGQVTVDIKTNVAIPTKDFINVNVDAVAKLQVLPDQDGIRLSAKNFLNMTAIEISKQVQDSLEGNMREVTGSLTLTEINIDRDKFSDQIMSKAQMDMNALGLKIISCNIQNITDENNLIRDLGADNTYSIKKNAAITKAEAERDIAQAQARASKDANDVQVEAQTEIAIKQNQLSIKRAELKVLEDIKKAEADAAYSIQEQEQRKVINVKTVDAQIEQTKREQELTAEKVKIRENELRAMVQKQADADKYQIEVNAEAALEQSKRNAEAEAYRAEQEARAAIARAEAKKQSMMLEAEGIKSLGEAEAYKIRCAGEAEAVAIEKKGIAEAEAMQKKADAYKEYGQAAILDMLVNIIPETAKNVATPLSAIDNMNVYGTSGNDAASVSGAVPTVIKQTFDVIESATGVNLASIMKANTIEAKTTRNVKLDTDSDVNLKK